MFNLFLSFLIIDRFDLNFCNSFLQNTTDFVVSFILIANETIKKPYIVSLISNVSHIIKDIHIKTHEHVAMTKQLDNRVIIRIRFL